ncbi:MAG: transposase [Thermococcales archaeon 44_46]|uniref:RNA-guided endonuclease InsQ/TnpB family protein n=1 Tax=Thermococcus sp. PK TaxID=913025 RepID=UPI000693F731|nr:RNA-guided endonuclease TnpB family protein [Thermococcus sp. PK]KUJ98421.1 MAG: transposase [Thermococcales archaeon 44_46]HIH72058.1 IS200/IS605 family element transposase accessory protein TnpB [Thermococcaceae archaeon]
MQNSSSKNETIVRAYSIPLRANDVILNFIEEYHNMAKTTLQEILNAKKFTKVERKQLRDKLLENWSYAAHYVDSAINQMLGLVKSYKRKLKKGKKVQKPRLKKKLVYVKSTLFRLKGTRLKITIVPREYYLEIDLAKYHYLHPLLEEIKEGKVKLGGLFLFPEKLILNFVKSVEYFEPKDWMSIDINLTNITALAGLTVYHFDTRGLYHTHRVYEVKRQKIQRISAWNRRLSGELLEKYSGRERNRMRDFLHKLANKIVEIAYRKRMGIILEDLRGIKEKVLNGSKDFNRKISKWNARELQRLIEYKAKWFGVPVVYVNPRNSSRTCPACGGQLIPQEGRLMKCSNCGLVEDRDFIAVLNLRMWGSGVTPKGLEVSRAGKPNEGPMKTNPYGIIVIEKQRIGIKFHKITLTSPQGKPQNPFKVESIK